MEKLKRMLAYYGRLFYVKNIDSDYHTEFGFVKKEDLKKKKGIVKTNTGKEFCIFEPSFIDLFHKIKRAPQIIPRKDVAAIIAETGLNKKSKVLDAGTGSGALACMIGAIAKSVMTYEIREDFLKIAKENIEFLGLKNVKIKHKDIYEGADEKDFDVFVLDVPEPWKAIQTADKALKNGGFFVSYSPTIPQVSDFIQELKKSNHFIIIKTIEIQEREWEVDERKVRPKSTSIGHSGFMTFARKIS